MEKDYKYMVCTRCFTFNHASYIVDAMNGFAMQETTFPVVTVIVDDASTDGEQDVIRKYLSEHFQEPSRVDETQYAYIICADHKSNPHCQFVVLYLKYNHYSIKKDKFSYISEWLDNSKYHAFCEGDDYWICADKLQKQVSFLEKNPSFIECTHNFLCKEERKDQDSILREPNSYKKLPFSDYDGVNGFVFDKGTYWNGWYTQPLSVVFRNGDYYKKIPRGQYKYYRDFIEHYYILHQGKGMLLQEKMGVYRKHNGGIYSGSDVRNHMVIFYESIRTMYLFEKDKDLLPILYNSALELFLIDAKGYKISRLVSTCVNYYNTVPWREKIFFPFRFLRDIIRNRIRKIISVLRHL